MIDLIEENRQAIEDLCQQHGVQKLAVFGSAVTGTWDPARSDIDFVLEMSDYGRGVASRFIGFADALEALVHRPVDLVFFSKLTRPGFREEVLETMEMLIDESARASDAAAA